MRNSEISSTNGIRDSMRSPSGKREPHSSPDFFGLFLEGWAGEIPLGYATTELTSTPFSRWTTRLACSAACES